MIFIYYEMLTFAKTFFLYCIFLSLFKSLEGAIAP